MKRFAVTLLAVMFILAGCGKSDSMTPTRIMTTVHRCHIQLII